MSDILQNAESLCGMFALPLQDDGRPDAQLINLVPDLVAEIKRLRALNPGIMLTYEPAGPVTFNGIEGDEEAQDALTKIREDR